MGYAIFSVEYASIAYGIKVLDKIIKGSGIHVYYSSHICIGKYLIIVGGDVGEVLEAKKVVEELGTYKLINSYYLSNAHESIIEYFEKRNLKCDNNSIKALGIVETINASSGLGSLDKALKSGSVQLRKILLGQFIGGKFCYILAGELSALEASIENAINEIDKKSIIDSVVIASPDRAMIDTILK